MSAIKNCNFCFVDASKKVLLHWQRCHFFQSVAQLKKKKEIFVLQFFKKKKRSFYKRCFFNTKYLPKHQGVSCCDLLHLQYLSDVSPLSVSSANKFFQLIPLSRHRKKEPNRKRSEYNERKESKVSGFIIKAYAVASFE